MEPDLESTEEDEQEHDTQEDIDIEDDPANSCNKEGESSEEDSDEDMEIEEPKVSADSPQKDSTYRGGLRALSEMLAGEFQHKFPFVVAETEGADQIDWPEWALRMKANSVVAPPSCAMILMVNEMDKEFLKQHRDDVDRKPGVCKR